MTEVESSQSPDDAAQHRAARALRDALARQHAAPKSPEEQAEREAWKRIRAAQAERSGAEPDQC